MSWSIWGTLAGFGMGLLTGEARRDGRDYLSAAVTFASAQATLDLLEVASFPTDMVFGLHTGPLPHKPHSTKLTDLICQYPRHPLLHAVVLAMSRVAVSRPTQPTSSLKCLGTFLTKPEGNSLQTT